jgi:hypothetical protein
VWKSGAWKGQRGAEMIRIEIGAATYDALAATATAPAKGSGTRLSSRSVEGSLVAKDVEMATAKI